MRILILYIVLSTFTSNLFSNDPKLLNSFKDIIPNNAKRVSINSILSAFFDPANIGCNFDQRVNQKIKERSLPDISSPIANLINTDSATYLMDRSLSDYFNNAKIINGKNTYESFAPNSAVNNLQSNYMESNQGLLYTLDCSGYVVLALSARAGISSADIKTQLDGSFKAGNTIVLGVANFYSPIYLALYPFQQISSKPNPLSSFERLQILTNLMGGINSLDVDTSSLVDVPFKSQILWTTKTQTSALNGSATIISDANASAGFASVDFKGNAGGDYSKKYTFNNMQTYLLGIVADKDAQRSLGYVQEQIIHLTNDALVEVHHEDKNYYIIADFPSVYKEASWQLSDGLKIDGVSYSENQRQLKFKIYGEKISSLKKVTLTGNFRNISLSREIDLD